ncbi:site-specific integrase [Pseudoalteromonas distincta]|uniref:site-specific integrase n=1 Tax=Pseudoalteromonas distincta TaxID=77608 RepID=UPI0011907991|nr:site-specific integrase [Pseudoalteromonas elyakovii]TVU70425.1 site-specific integrase [Pseudoalteromonas elyakovii]
MAKKKSLKQQAQSLIRSKMSKNDTQSKETVGNFKQLKSIRSKNEVILAITKIAKDLGVDRLKHITKEKAEEYLKNSKDGYASQKSIDRNRRALSIALGHDLKRVTAISEQKLSTRAYASNQIKEITNSMNDRNSLAVRIAHNAGLRAHELLTLKKINEGEKTKTRTWDQKRFVGREGVTYLVTGKGGLTREVMLSKSLSNELEDRRLSSPKTTMDRGVNYLQRYDIGGGNALSASFTRASQRSLTFSHGLHGVRHRYAQERLDEIKDALKVNHDIARDILAQELGHFRGDITEVYLR